MKDFVKAYATMDELERATTAFEENLRVILEHNSKADLSNGGHELGVNEFADIRAEEMPTGYVKKVPVTEEAALTATSRRRLEQDMEEKLPIKLKPVQDLLKRELGSLLNFQ